MVNLALAAETDFARCKPKGATRELRRFYRYRCRPASFGKLCIPHTKDTLLVLVQNISRKGIGLYLPHPLKGGAHATILLRIAGERTPHRFSLRLVHCTQEVNRSWGIGCEFFEAISTDLLDNLLR
ncbi:MAG: PilZ domain-containing protein [Planctomycetes bacterium]|nr:PilZ domain-containing protein [Planctomycetota bacterium]